MGEIPGTIGDQYYRKPKWLRRLADPVNLFPEDPRSASRKAKRHPDITIDESGEVADRERRRRSSGQRQTILTGALGPAGSRGSVLTGT